MSHCPIQVNDIALSFPQKICFDHFTARIIAGSRIGIIGRNGTGKSTLLNIPIVTEESEFRSSINSKI